ncbi:MAG: hypothetical protein AMJ60_10225 [Desulfobacterales bacterium SG8_35]|nr:MAG: hypothetical protein AMJ60_10225 [Desulfobacterales bacterium SG8_35]
MDANVNYNCWDIMNCENIDCHARHEPETPCWDIARRIEAFHNVSNTCNDCIVYIFKNEISILSTKKAQNIIQQRLIDKNLEAKHKVCVRVANTTI